MLLFFSQKIKDKTLARGMHTSPDLFVCLKIIAVFTRARSHKHKNSHYSDKILKILKISPDFQNVFLSNYSEENFKKSVQPAAPNYALVTTAQILSNSKSGTYIQTSKWRRRQQKKKVFSQNNL